MTYRDGGEVIDLSYTLVRPNDVTRLFGLPYRVVARIHPALPQYLLQLARLRLIREVEYYTERVLDRLPLLFAPSPNISILTLAKAHDVSVVIATSREGIKRVGKSIQVSGFAPYIDDTVCQKDVGRGAIDKAHVIEGVRRLEEHDIPRERRAIITDSESDYEPVEGEAKFLWVTTGPQKKLRKLTPTHESGSSEEALSWWIGWLQENRRPATRLYEMSTR